MKKLIAILICVVLAASAALADGSFIDPFNLFQDGHSDDAGPRGGIDSGDGGANPEEGIALTVDGETVRLAFDPSPQYSSVQGGMVQASYFAYGADGVSMYELYLSFPATAKPGMIITPEYEAITNGDASVSLIVSRSKDDLVYYFSSLAEGIVYPVDSDFSIAIDSIDGTSAGTRYSGSFSATLIALDMGTGAVMATLNIPETPFSFTLKDGSAPEAAPAPTAAPEDMRKV